MQPERDEIGQGLTLVPQREVPHRARAALLQKQHLHAANSCDVSHAGNFDACTKDSRCMWNTTAQCDANVCTNMTTRSNDCYAQRARTGAVPVHRLVAVGGLHEGLHLPQQIRAVGPGRRVLRLLLAHHHHLRPAVVPRRHVLAAPDEELLRH